MLRLRTKHALLLRPGRAGCAAMQINRGPIHMPLQRRRAKSARSRDARPRAGINAAPQGIIRGPSALDARVEPRVKSAESLFLGVALASNRRAIEMIEQIFSVGIESSGISLIGASPSEQTVCDTSKLFTRCVTRLEQDHRREGRYSWMMVLSGKADEDGGYDFGANATAGRGRGARLETARPSARGSLPARREILIPRGHLAQHRTPEAFKRSP